MLDGLNLENEEVFSSEDEDDYGSLGEDGEEELNEEFILQNMTEE